MNLHYVPAVSLNVPSPTPRPTSRVQKRPMDSLSYTFEKLKEVLSFRLKCGTDIATSSGPNMRSALDAFMAERGFSPNEAVASSLRASFRRNLSEHVEHLRTQGRSNTYIANRKSLLQKWRELLLDCDRTCAASAGRRSPFQVALSELITNGRTVKGTARECGIPLATLKRWLGGSIPTERSVHRVPRIECHFGLPAGTLTDLLLPRRVRQADQPAGAPNLYRERLKKQTLDTYAVKVANQTLREQWNELVRFKSANGHVLVAGGRRLKRAPNGQWSMTDKPVVPQTPANWFAFRGSKYVATAHVNWTMTSQYLGWLMRSPARGGKGLAEADALTLSNFARGEFIDEYIEWRTERSEGTHSGVITFLTFAASLCNPRTGFLSQQPSLYARFLGFDDEAQWLTHCTEVHAHLVATRASRSLRRWRVCAGDSPSSPSATLPAATVSVHTA